MSAIKKGITLVALSLAGCVSQSPQFAVPDAIHFGQDTFVKVTHSQIDEMQHLLYLPEKSEKNPENWQKGILFFLDKNSKNQTLEQRAAFRQASFAKKPELEAKVEIQQNELHSSVIYPPTERFNNVMLEVTRGRNLACGYGQIQFADKREVGKTVAKKSPNLTAYSQEIAKLSLELNQLGWQVQCSK
ncbi:TPA: ABC transporter ATPase [Mannheimia haemolytica]